MWIGEHLLVFVTECCKQRREDHYKVAKKSVHGSQSGQVASNNRPVYQSMRTQYISSHVHHLHIMLGYHGYEIAKSNPNAC
jgi:hypothetical protein